MNNQKEVYFKTGKYKGRSVSSMANMSEMAYLYFLYYKVFDRSPHKTIGKYLEKAVRDKLFEIQKDIFEIVLSYSQGIVALSLFKERRSMVVNIVKDEITYNKKYMLRIEDLCNIQKRYFSGIINKEFYEKLKNFHIKHPKTISVVCAVPNYYKRKILIEKMTKKFNTIDVIAIMDRYSLALLDELPF